MASANAGLIDVIPSGYSHVCARPNSGRAGQSGPGPAWRWPLAFCPVVASGDKIGLVWNLRPNLAAAS